VQTRLQGRVRLGVLVIALLMAAYTGVFCLVRYFVPPAAGMSVALSAVPVAVGAWFFGVRGGLGVVLLCIPVNAALLNTFGYSGWSAITDPKGGFGTVLIVLIAAGGGWARNLYYESRRELGERRRAEGERDQLLREATERARELSCMHGVARLIQSRATAEDVFWGTAALVPSGMHYPDVTGARVHFDGAEYVSEHFTETPWRLTRDIVVAGERRGAVEVCYIGEWPEAGDGPFLREEAHLIGGIARSLAEMVQRQEAEETARRETLARAALAEIGRIVSSSLETSDVYKGFAEQAGKLIPFDRIVIAEIDREQDTMTDVYVWGMEVRGRAADSSYPLCDDMGGQVAGLRNVERGAPIVLDGDAMRSVAERCPEEAASVEAGLLSALAVPIIWREEVIGSLNFRSREENAYSERTVDLAERISDQIAGAIATSRLHVQALQDAREREVLAEIGRVIGSTLDLDEVYEEFAVQVRYLLPADLLTVYVVSEPDSVLVAEHVAGDETAGIARGDRLLMGQVAAAGLFPYGQGRVFNREAIVSYAERLGVPAEQLHAGFRSTMAVPLMSGDETIGVLCLRSERDDVYSERHLALAERVGAQIAGAIANSKLHERAQRDAEERSVLAEMGRIVTSSLEIGEVYERFADRVRGLLPSNWVIIAAVDLERGTATHTCVVGEVIPGRTPGETFTLPGTLTEAVCRKRSGVMLGSESPEEVVARFPGTVATISQGGRSALSVPLISHDSVIGVLHVVSREPNAYSERDLVLAERIADQIAGAVASANLHAEVQRQSREREVLAEIGRIISSSLDIDSVCERFAKQVQRLLPFDMISITTVDLEEGTAIHAYAQDEAALGRPIGEVIPLAGTLTEAVAKGGSALVLRDQHPDYLTARFPGLEPVVNAGARSVLAAPMVSEGLVIGALQLTSKEPNAYSERDLALAERIADQIAGAVASANLHAEVQRQSGEREVLAEIGQIISSSLDIGEVYEQFAKEVRRLIPFDRMAIAAPGLEEGTMTNLFVTGVEMPGWEPGTSVGLPTHEKGGTFAEWVRAGKPQPLILGTDEARALSDCWAPAAAAVEVGLVSVLYAPIVWEGASIADLVLRSKTENAYSEEDARLSERVAAQIAGTIANAHLHAELQVRGAALDAAADMIVITDRNGTIEYVNEAFTGQTGYEQDEAVGQNPRILKSSQQDTAYYKDLWDTITAGQVWKGTLVNRREDGSEYPEEMTITPVPGADGEIARFIAIKRDISQRIRAEKESALRRRLDAENRELHRVNEAKSRFLSTVSHELKTPLTSIIAFTDLLVRNREGNLTSRQNAHLEVVQRNNHRLNDLIKDLLDVSRIDGGGLNLDRADFDARRLLEEVANDFTPILSEKGQVLERSIPDRDMWMRGDQNRLAQVVSNLFSNASKYSPEHSEIRLVAREEGGALHLEVRDNGVGIAREDVERLFTPFFRADNEVTRSVSGTGLGLVITKAIIDEHGGSITVDSTPGVGTTVRVSIPRIVEQKAA